jgi:hypothetical protein
VVVVVACHSETGGSPEPSSAGGMTADSGASATSAGEAVGGGRAGAASVEGIPIVPLDGWVDATNPLGVRGEFFADADAVTRETLETDFEGSNICIRGTAAKVDVGCVPVPPARDCFEQSFGAFLGFNLSQERGGEPEPFDASHIKRLTFELTGPQRPPTLNFSLDAADGGTYCVPLPGVEGGFEDQPSASHDVVLDPIPRGTCGALRRGETLGAVMPKLVRVRWSVSGNTREEVPFDFCVQNLRASTE